jgi:hypothetical protein
MFWIIILGLTAIIALNALSSWLTDRQKGIIRGKGYFHISYDGLPQCPDCGVLMDLINDGKEARCHDCHRVFLKPPD